jgi:hypothetical protein
LANAAVFDLKASPLPAGQGAIVAVTHGRGAWRLANLAELIFVDDLESGGTTNWTATLP